MNEEQNQLTDTEIAAKKVMVEIHPFPVPDVVFAVGDLRPSGEGFCATHTISLMDVGVATLDAMCNDFRDAVFMKAGIKRVEITGLGAEQAQAPTDFRERVREEKRELDERMERLSAFLDTDMYRSLPDDEQERMGEQLALQQELSRVLGDRIANFKAD